MIEVDNDGGSTAADARIEAELRQHGSMVEHSEITIDFCSTKVEASGGVLFARDPRTSELKLRPSAYREP